MGDLTQHLKITPKQLEELKDGKIVFIGDIFYHDAKITVGVELEQGEQYGSGRGGLFTLTDLSKRYGITASQVGRYLNSRHTFADEWDGGIMLFTYEKVQRIDKERGFDAK